MYFNEENTMQGNEYSDTNLQSTDLELDAAGNSNASGNYDQDQFVDNVSEGCKDNKCEEIDLDFDVLANQTDVEDEYHEGCGAKCDEKCEEVDLDYDALKNNGFKVDSTPYTSKDAIDLDFDALANQTDTEDEYHEEVQTDLPVVEDVSFSESSVRVFQRSNYNLITESDILAVMQYHNYTLSEEEVFESIAAAHNLSEDSLVVLHEGLLPVKKDSKVKKVAPKKSGIDIQIANLLAKKKTMTPEKWKNGGYDKKLKELRARKVLQNK